MGNVVTPYPAIGEGISLNSNGYVHEAAKWSGKEVDYVEKTSTTSVTATTEGTANTVLTSNNINCDGGVIVIQLFAYLVTTGTNNLTIVLLEDTTVLGQIARVTTAGTYPGVSGYLRRTPTPGFHSYVAKAFVDAGTGNVDASTGGSGKAVAAFLRITRA